MRAARRLAALGERRKVVEHIAVDRARVTLLEHVGLATLQAQVRGKDAGRGQSTSATRVGRYQEHNLALESCRPLRHDHHLRRRHMRHAPQHVGRETVEEHDAQFPRDS